MKTSVASTATFLLAAIFLLLVSGCQQTTLRAPPDSASAAAWDDYVAALLESEFEADPPTAVWAGRHEFDGRLPDWSRTGVDNEIRRRPLSEKRVTC